VSEDKMQDAGCKIQDAGYRIENCIEQRAKSIE
jgi:hypothetical protein